MNAKNYLTYVHIPQEDKPKSYSFLLQYRIHFHFALLTPTQCLAHSRHSDICWNNSLSTFCEYLGRGKLGGETSRVLTANVHTCVNKVLHSPPFQKRQESGTRSLDTSWLKMVGIGETSLAPEVPLWCTGRFYPERRQISPTLLLWSM